MKKGDLIYIPADTTLLNIKKNLVPHKVLKLTKPTSAILMSNEPFVEKYFQIFYNESDSWYVHKNDVSIKDNIYD